MPSPLQQSLHIQPVGEAFDPMVGRQMLLAHAKAVSALGIEVRRLSSRDPILVNRDASSEAATINAGGASAGTPLPLIAQLYAG